MTNPSLICASCTNWQPLDRTAHYTRACDLGYGQTAFNATCQYHSERGKQAELPLQSQTRGDTYQQWVKRLTGKV